jgi:hypothetical protein
MYIEGKKANISVTSCVATAYYNVLLKDRGKDRSDGKSRKKM